MVTRPPPGRPRCRPRQAAGCPARAAPATRSWQGRGWPGWPGRSIRLRRTVEPLLGLPDRVDDLTRLATDLTNAVAALTARRAAPAVPVVAAAAHRPRPRRPACSTSWSAGSPRCTCATPTARDHLPECWCWHPDVVEELLWLMHAWAAAYQGPQRLGRGWWGTGTTASAPASCAASGRRAGSCSVENHQTRAGWTRRPPAAPTVPGADSVDVDRGWWAHRRDQHAPEPHRPG